MKIKGIRYSSFFIGDDLIEKYNRVFIKFDSKWFEFVVSEGMTTIKIIKGPPLKSVSEIKDEFKYTISELNDFFFQEMIYAKFVLSISKLVMRDNPKFDIGVKILLDNNHYIFIHDNYKNENMELIFDKIEITDDFLEKSINVEYMHMNGYSE